MCGIFGWVTRRPVVGAELWIEEARVRLAHRGPDGSGLWRGMVGNAEVALLHLRLAIIDIEGSPQPFWSHDGRYAIAFNGEIYNYLELRAELIALGHQFRSEGDTEVVIEAWRAWGEAALQRFRGMFAFALCDLAEGRTVLARDPFGKKPLFLVEIPGGVAFASEIPALIAGPMVGARLNESVLTDYFVARYVDGPQTFFEGVRKLPPGSLLIHDAKGVQERRYFSPPFARTSGALMGEDEAERAFAATLERAVELRMRSDAPYGVFLSGGLDSSVIAALMQRHSAEPIRTYSVGFDVEGSSELP